MADIVSQRLQYVALGREGAEFKLGPVMVNGAVTEKDALDPKFNPAVIPSVKDVEFCSESGKFIAVLQADGFFVLNADDGQLITKIDRAGIQRVCLSPLGNYALTWEKHVGGENSNLLVWRLSDSEIVWSAVEKNLLATTWPTVKWSSDETIAAHMTANTVSIYDGSGFSKLDKLRYDGLAQFSIWKKAGDLSDSNSVKIACFKPEKKGGPAKLALFQFPGSLETPVSGKTFFKAQEAQFKWSPKGNAFLCKTDTDVDTTGQSYYGESALYLVHSNGRYDCKILPAKEGSFHDFAWCPDGKSFVAISGKSPATSILYNVKGDVEFEFGAAHRNTIRWSPHGRFLCLGGFGNLSGDMDFWDVSTKRKLGSTRANCAVSQEWSPCSRFFMTGTLFPRMRVDNGLTFYTYRGELLYTVNIRECSKGLWRPVAEGVYADRPPTPDRARIEATPPISGHGTATDGVGAKPAPSPAAKQAYRPPGSSGAFASMLRADRSGSAAPRTLASLASQAETKGTIGGSTYVPVGAAPPGAAPVAKTKSALKREKKKRAAANKAAAGQ